MYRIGEQHLATLTVSVCSFVLMFLLSCVSVTLKYIQCFQKHDNKVLILKQRISHNAAVNFVFLLEHNLNTKSLTINPVAYWWDSLENGCSGSLSGPVQRWHPFVVLSSKLWNLLAWTITNHNYDQTTEQHIFGVRRLSSHEAKQLTGPPRICGVDYEFGGEWRQISVLQSLWTWPVSLSEPDWAWRQERGEAAWIFVQSIWKSPPLQWLTGGEAMFIFTLIENRSL